MFKDFYSEYGDEVLYLSGYTMKGWLYARKNIKQSAKNYNIKIIERCIEYPLKSDDYELVKESKRIISEEYE